MRAVLLHVSSNDAWKLTCGQCCFMYLRNKLTPQSGTQQVTPRNMLAMLLHVNYWLYSRRMAVHNKCRRIVNKNTWCMYMQAQCKTQKKKHSETGRIAALQVCLYHKMNCAAQSERIYVHIYLYTCIHILFLGSNWGLKLFRLKLIPSNEFVLKLTPNCSGIGPAKTWDATNAR